MTIVKNLSSDELVAAYQALRFPPQQNRPTILFNMVATLDGVTTIADTPSGAFTDAGIGGSLDRKLMKSIRSHADCTLNSAATFRAMQGKLFVSSYSDGASEKTNRFWALISRSAQFPPALLQTAFFTDNSVPSILFVTSDTPKAQVDAVRQAATKPQFFVVTLPNRADNVVTMCQILYTDFQVKTVVVEGGAGLNGSLLAAGLGDHFFLTIAPYLALMSPNAKGITAHLTTLIRSNLLPLELISAYSVPEFAGLFTHWSIAHAA